MRGEDVLLHPTAEDVEQIRVGLHLSPEGEHHLVSCPLCALPQWRSTWTDRAPAIVMRLDTAPCPRCEEIRYRHPEVFEWMVRILNGQKLIARLEPRLEENSK
jgi:hypothetical protein